MKKWIRNWLGLETVERVVTVKVPDEAMNQQYERLATDYFRLLGQWKQVIEDVKSEAFIDSVVERINKKQLK